MKFTPNEMSLTHVFDEALQLREAGQLEAAATMLEELTAKLVEGDKRLRLHSYLQLGYIAKLRGEDEKRLEYFARAAGIAPRAELASISLFLALANVSRHEEAMREALRFLREKFSLEYEELFAQGHESGLPENAAAMVVEARRLLQRSRTDR